MGILLGDIIPLGFLLCPLCFRAVRGSQGLSDYSYKVAVGHFSPRHHPEGFWLLHTIQKAKGVAMGATRSIARECVASRSHIYDILQLEAAA